MTLPERTCPYSQILLVFDQDSPEYEQEYPYQDRKNTDHAFEKHDDVGEKNPYPVCTQDKKDDPRNKTRNTCFIHFDYVLSSFSTVFDLQEDKHIDARGWKRAPAFHRGRIASNFKNECLDYSDSCMAA